MQNLVPALYNIYWTDSTNLRLGLSGVRFLRVLRLIFYVNINCDEWYTTTSVCLTPIFLLGVVFRDIVTILGRVCCISKQTVKENTIERERERERERLREREREKSFQRATESIVKGRIQLKCDGTRWRRGGEVKGRLANGVGGQYPSHYLGTWCIQHYYRWCAHLGCQ